MARDGSGNMSVPYPDFVGGTTISSSEMDANFADVVTELTNSLAADGQTTPTANLPMGSNKFTGLAAGSAATDSANLGQVQAQAYIWCGTAGGTADAITLSPSPAITAYAAGQTFRWKASASANTGAMTVAISGLTTIAAQSDLSALSAGDHEANAIYEGTLDTTSTIQIRKIALAGTGYSDPLTTRGDLVYRDASSTTRLAIGAANTVLKSDGTDAAWGDVAVADLADGTDGELITWDASGNPATVSVGTSGQILTSNGAGSPPTFQDAATAGLTLGTEQVTTSGTSVTFSSIPSGTKLIIFTLEGVSLSGSGDLLVQVGDSGGVETTGYDSDSTQTDGTNGSTASSTSGFIVRMNDAASSITGQVILTLSDASNFTWISSHTAGFGTGFTRLGGGAKSLSAELDRVVLTTTAGNFDAGAVNVQYM